MNIKTVNENFSYFIQYQKIRVKKGSVSNYYSLGKNHLLYFFGNRIMDSITENELLQFVEKEKYHNLYSSAPLSEKTYHDIIVLINSFWKFMHEHGNISNNIILPLSKPSEPQIVTFNSQEYDTLTKHLMTHLTPFNLGILISLLTGIRIGELCALQWCDIDLANGVLKITKTLQRIKNMDEGAKTKTKIIIDTPKTKRSVRDIPIPDFLLNILQIYKKHGMYYILTNSNNYAEPRTLQSYFKKLLCTINIEYKKFHTLRHTFATNANNNGMDIKTLSEILGHENEAYTMKKYIHLNFEHKRNKMNGIYYKSYHVCG